ncbi:hypothetical protein PWT90_08345 [Aphanocladium album]|nr:hypothetical protein PWT90_08345 [Aphanocladium album]
MPTKRQMRSVSECSRGRETRRYAAHLLGSAIKNDTGKPISGVALRTSSDANLTALAQLGALRTSTARSLVSIFDENYQYIVAEATTSLRLAADLAQKDHGESLWLCGTAIPRAHGVCDYTVCGLDPDGYTESSLESSELPFTKIDNLTTSPRFSVKPYCLPGGPAQFYAAVPIRTKRGINIGVYCVIHSEPVPTWSGADTRVLREISDIIMEHLEAKRDRANHRRTERMSRGLGSFLEQQSSLAGWQDGAFPGAFTDQPELEGSLNSLQQAAQLRSDIPPTRRGFNGKPTYEQERLPPPHQSQVFEREGEQPLSPVQQPEFKSNRSRPALEPAKKSFRATSMDERDSVNVIFGKAANLIRESIETEGCVFVDPSTTSFGSFSAEPDDSSAAERALMSTSAGSGEESGEQGQGSRPTPFCTVFGFSTTQQHSINGDSDGPFRGQINQKFVAALLRRYPQGRLFGFDSNGELLSSDFSDSTPTSTSAKFAVAAPLSPLEDQKHPRANIWAREHEGRNLLQIFPGAQSVAFLPIWDPKKEQWNAAGFIYTHQEARSFTEDSELSFLRVFGLLIMDAVFRQVALKADKAKADALSCISHELRSPLHGVLLSVELLNDTSMSVFQRNMSHAIETCSRTLAETLDHLLDYSKINQFDAVIGKGKNYLRPRGLRPTRQNTVDDGLMSLQSVVNLDTLVEEVVESVFAGFHFQFMSVRQLAEAPEGQFADNAGNSRLDGIRAVEDLSFDISKSEGQTAAFGSVSVFLTIDPQSNWTFFTEAGAIRRIVMNLFANSLKYTRKGAIKVSLTQKASKPNRSKKAAKIVITVADTGVGMSQDYLDNQLFNPFSQADRLSPGTGLGLSIVKKIVSQHRGRISVRSSLNVGTTIAVTLPLLHPELPIGPSDPSADARLGAFEDGVRELCGLRVGLLNLTLPDAANEVVDPTGQRLDSSSALRNICTEWLKLEIVEEADIGIMRPDLIILSADMHEEYARNKNLLDFPTVVLCQNALAAYRCSTQQSSTSTKVRTIEFISQPIGPQKLGKSLALALHRWQDLQSIRPDSLPSESEGASSTEQDHLFTPTTPPPVESYFAAAGPELPGSDSCSLPRPVDFPQKAQQRPKTRPVIVRQALSSAMPYLLVDDNAINIRILSTFMTKLKKKFSTATNGQEAVDAYKKASESFRCVFMDISMPVMDGLEATRAIRTYERENKLPSVVIIALTGLASSEAQRDALVSGVDLFLTKPVKLAELAAILTSRGLLGK